MKTTSRMFISFVAIYLVATLLGCQAQDNREPTQEVKDSAQGGVARGLQHRLLRSQKDDQVTADSEGLPQAILEDAGAEEKKKRAAHHDETKSSDDRHLKISNEGLSFGRSPRSLINVRNIEGSLYNLQFKINNILRNIMEFMRIFCIDDIYWDNSSSSRASAEARAWANANSGSSNNLYWPIPLVPVPYTSLPGCGSASSANAASSANTARFANAASSANTARFANTASSAIVNAVGSGHSFNTNCRRPSRFPLPRPFYDRSSASANAWAAANSRANSNIYNPACYGSNYASADPRASANSNSGIQRYVPSEPLNLNPCLKH